MQFLNKPYNLRETTASLENTVDDEDELVENEQFHTIIERDTTYYKQKRQGKTER